MTEADFLKCCGSANWARRMARVSGEDLSEAAERIWWSLEPEDWLEAFRAHPKIGETADSKWSEQEQAVARKASREDLSELRALNRIYEERFGYIFIICATGKTAEEIMGFLEQRLNNDTRTELRTAAEQQIQITRLRMQKLLTA